MLHADLRRIAKGEKMEMTVPIRLIGEAQGLKEEGAVLSQALREIKVLCEPANTPDSIDVDISGLDANHPVHVSDLKVAPGIEIHESPDTLVASIVIRCRKSSLSRRSRKEPNRLLLAKRPRVARSKVKAAATQNSFVFGSEFRNDYDRRR